jgi:hypothetical protein
VSFTEHGARTAKALDVGREQLSEAHLILLWETVRIIVDVLSLWGLAWMLGMMASFSVQGSAVLFAGTSSSSELIDEPLMRGLR